MSGRAPLRTPRSRTAGRDGVPVSYTVAHNDIAEEVAARFGITVIELFYLNPAGRR